MYSDILSLIFILYMLLFSCAARVVVRDTEVAPDIAATATDAPANTPVAEGLWATAVHDEIIPIRAVGRGAAETRMTPPVGALWQTGVHQELSPSQVNDRADEPEATPLAGTFWQVAVHKWLASKRC
ncbi:hypothetical protein DFH29DRAFT_1076561 [Suillus ampliporus]|nr:hypothetical protein DFH29DRAFT_1076561 [Suillus ampliporus]